MKGRIYPQLKDIMATKATSQDQPMPDEQAQTNAKIQQLEQQLAQMGRVLREMQQAQQQQQQPAAGEKTLLKPPSYHHSKAKDEEGGFLIWRSAFMEVCRANQWSNQTAKAAAKASMRGVAGKTVYDMNTVAYLNIQSLLDAFEQRFVPAAEANLAKVDFDQAAQGAKETIQEFHSRCRMLWFRAYPRDQENTQLRRRFALGLRDADVRKHVLRVDPETYEGSLAAAQNEKAVVMQTNHYGLGAPLRSAEEEPMEIGAIKAGVSKPEHQSSSTLGACPVCEKPGHSVEKCFTLARMKSAYERERSMAKYRKERPGAAKQPQRQWRKKFSKKLMAALEELHINDSGEEEEVSSEDNEGEESPNA